MLICFSEFFPTITTLFLQIFPLIQVKFIDKCNCQFRYNQNFSKIQLNLKLVGWNVFLDQYSSKFFYHQAYSIHHVYQQLQSTCRKFFIFIVALQLRISHTKSKRAWYFYSEFMYLFQRVKERFPLFEFCDSYPKWEEKLRKTF